MEKIFKISQNWHGRGARGHTMAPAKWCLSGCLGLISAWGETSVQLFRESPWGIRSLNNSMSGWGPTFIKIATTVLPSVSTPLIMRPCGSSQEVESVFHS